MSPVYVIYYNDFPTRSSSGKKTRQRRGASSPRARLEITQTRIRNASLALLQSSLDLIRRQLKRAEADCEAQVAELSVLSSLAQMRGAMLELPLLSLVPERADASATHARTRARARARAHLSKSRRFSRRPFHSPSSRFQQTRRA